MTSVLFLYPYPAGTAASQRFRFEHFIQSMSDRGYVVTRQAFWPRFAWDVLYRDGHPLTKAVGFLVGLLRRLFIVMTGWRFDFIFLHRECMPIGPPWVEWILAKVWRRKVIYDFDDAIWIPKTTDSNRWAVRFKHPQKVSTICQMSYRISAGNSFLASWAKKFNDNVTVVPTVIDTEALHNPVQQASTKNTAIVTVGWTGTHSTLTYLSPLVPVLNQIAHEHPEARFLVIADKNPAFEIPGYQFRPWRKETEIPDLLDIDIGVMPLENDSWTKGKCGFKLLQFMALEIPSLASPVGVNSDIVQPGTNGFLCSSKDEWFETLNKLITDEAMRKKIGAAGREKVVRDYSVISVTPTFFSLFS